MVIKVWVFSTIISATCCQLLPPLDWSGRSTSGPGVAVGEFPLKTGFADYLLYVDGKVIGVIEVKPEGHTLTGAETQPAKYTAGLPDVLPNYGLPLPFDYESTGTVTQFTDSLERDARSRELFTFHRAEELKRASYYNACPVPGRRPRHRVKYRSEAG
jgi:type I site-specific restriction endonuclease